jgi:hypothetical protein
MIRARQEQGTCAAARQPIPQCSSKWGRAPGCWASLCDCSAMRCSRRTASFA